MKKKIIEALKTKYKNLGFGEKAFDGVATYLEPSVKEESDIETAIGGGVEGLLKAFQGETDTVRTAKAEAEKKLAEMEAKIKALTGGAPESEPTEPEKPKEDVPAWAAAIIEANKALSASLEALKSEKVVTGRQAQLKTIVGKLPESIRKSYEHIDCASMTDEQFQQLTANVSTEVDGILTDITVKGAAFGRPKTLVTTHAEDAVPPQIDQFLKAQAEDKKSSQPF